MADSAIGNESFDVAWGPFGRVAAVVSAALVALLGVVAHVPVWLACMRGAGALVLVLVLVRCAAFVADVVQRTRTARGPAAETKSEDERSHARRSR